MPDRKILVSAGIILTLGILRSVKENKKLSPVIEGTLILTLLLAALDALSPATGKVSGALAMLAVVAAITVEGPDLLGLGAGGVKEKGMGKK